MMPQNPWSRPHIRRRKDPAQADLVVPLVSPQRALHELRATIKPHDWTREAIRHRLAVDPEHALEQPWRPEWVPIAQAAALGAAQRLETAVDMPSPGAEHLRICFSPVTPEPIRRAIGVVCSRRLPRTWFVLGDLALLSGKFYRRERGYRLHLRRAADVHLPREIRSRLRGLLRASDIGKEHAQQSGEDGGEHPRDQ